MKPILLAAAVTFALSSIACDASVEAGEGDAKATASATADAQAAGGGHAHPEAVPSASRLQSDMRALWHGHVVATRSYALAVEAGDGVAAERAAQSVVANATSIAGAVASFYGAPAGEALLTLLGGHWNGVKALTDAQRRGDTAGAAQALDALVANAGEISVFLAGANPHLQADAVRGLLVAHGGHHAAQVQQIMAGDTAAEAKTWTVMQAHMDVLADALAGAIAQQFPDQAG
jgi:hypothetical protein